MSDDRTETAYERGEGGSLLPEREYSVEDERHEDEKADSHLRQGGAHDWVYE